MRYQLILELHMALRDLKSLVLLGVTLRKLPVKRYATQGAYPILNIAWSLDWCYEMGGIR